MGEHVTRIGGDLIEFDPETIADLDLDLDEGGNPTRGLCVRQDASRAC